eukprot:scaffold2879_cov145-Skeletonema_marinoi.AAC.1
MGKKKEVDTWSVPARTVCCLQFLADTWSVLVCINSDLEDTVNWCHSGLQNRLAVAGAVEA